VPGTRVLRAFPITGSSGPRLVRCLSEVPNIITKSEHSQNKKVEDDRDKGVWETVNKDMGLRARLVSIPTLRCVATFSSMGLGLRLPLYVSCILWTARIVCA